MKRRQLLVIAAALLLSFTANLTACGNSSDATELPESGTAESVRDDTDGKGTYADKTYYSDVSVDYAACEAINGVTEAGLMGGAYNGKEAYFEPEDMLVAQELFAALHRLAGAPEPISHWDEVKPDPLPEEAENKWYSDGLEWAAYNGMLTMEYYGGGPSSSYIGFVRYGSDEEFERYEDYISRSHSHTLLQIDQNCVDRHVTRSDVAVALYYYLKGYLGVIPSESADLTTFSDWDDDVYDFPYIYCYLQGSPSYELLYDAWSWAVGSGVMTGFPDNTLRIGRTVDIDYAPWSEKESITRVEFAEILVRFMDYLEEAQGIVTPRHDPDDLKPKIEEDKTFYSDVPADSYACEGINNITAAGLISGIYYGGNTYFEPENILSSHDMITSLYRLAGAPELLSPIDPEKIHYNSGGFVADSNNAYRSTSSDGLVWAVYTGVVPLSYRDRLDDFHTFRFCDGVNSYNALCDELGYAVSFQMYDPESQDHPVMRNDVALTLYYYLKGILGFTPGESADLSIFSDWNDYTRNDSDAQKHICEIQFGISDEELADVWGWALGSGVIESYSADILGIGDGDYKTFGEEETFTRAEYAMILDRFVDYLETLK